MQSLCAVGIVDNDLIFVLPLIIVVNERLCNTAVDLVGRQGLRILRQNDRTDLALYVGMLILLIPLRVGDEITVQSQNGDRHFYHMNERADRGGDI